MNINTAMFFLRIDNFLKKTHYHVQHSSVIKI